MTNRVTSPNSFFRFDILTSNIYVVWTREEASELKGVNKMDEKKGQENYKFCKFCSQDLTRRIQRTLTRCPNCGEPYFEN
jgi:uncharacterized CHY-type Zn-finger protein